MGYLWNRSSRQPIPYTHIMGWGKVGNILSYGTKTSLNDFAGTISFIEARPTAFGFSYEDANVSMENAVFSGNIGWGIFTKNDGTKITKGEMQVNNNSIPLDVLRPWSYLISGASAYNINLVNSNIICAGSNYFLAAYGNTLIGFGGNSYGQCNPPITSTANLIQVSAGFGHSVALYNDGTISSWGLNNKNQTSVPVGLTASQIASGYYHNIALKGDKTVVCWGSNDEGQCNVPAGLSGISFIAAGFRHSLAIRENGTVVCWGDNSSGQCNVPAGATGAAQIAGGSAHTALLKADGSVLCWGGTGFRQSILPVFPDTASDPATQYAIFKNRLYSPLGITGAATKVFCTENATFALCTGKRDRGNYMWAAVPGTLGLTGLVAVYATQFLMGPTGASAMSGMSFYTKLEGYDPTRHDYYTYPSQPSYGQSVWPNGINTAWWSNQKLDKCWVSGYQPNGIYKIYDSYFSPPDLSGCSIRPRQWGAPWIESSLDAMHNILGYIRKNTTEYGWNNFNSGYWPNIIITKKHTVCIGHYAGNNTNLYGVRWLRRDGTVITRDLTRISNLYFQSVGVNPDLYLYEMNTELTQDDLNNISVYNVWPKFSGFTGSKTIDTYAWVWKGLTYIDYNSIEMMSQVGRRLWYLDGQDRVYSKRVLGTYANPQTNYRPTMLKTISGKPHKYEPDDIECTTFPGDSGTPVFITAARQTGYTEPLEAAYFAGQGITVGRTLFCGTFDYGTGEYGSTFVNEINSILISRGLTGNELIKQIDVDSVGKSLPWTAPVTGFDEYALNSSSPNYSGVVSAALGGPETNTVTLIGEGVVDSWDSTNNILTLSGISGSFHTPGLTYYSIIQNLNDSTVNYSKINPYIIPINNGLGTTAGSNNILESEAAGYTFDPNNPFGDE